MLKQKLRNGLIVGLIVGVFGAVISYCRPSALETLELRTYDMRVRSAADPHNADPRIVMVDVDEGDITWVKRGGMGDVMAWPWPRELFGWVTDYLLNAGAKAVVFDFILEDEGRDAGDAERFAAALRLKPRTVLGLQLTNFRPRGRQKGPWMANLGAYLLCEEAHQDGRDLVWWQARVAVSPEPWGCSLWAGGEHSKAGLQRFLKFLADRDWKYPGAISGRLATATELKEITPALAKLEINKGTIARDKGRLSLPGADHLSMPRYKFLRPPLVTLVLGARQLGVVSQAPDPDGVFRHYAPVIRCRKNAYPSLALAAAMVAFPEKKIRVEGKRLWWGDVRIPRTENGRVAIRYHGSGKAYPRVGIRHVLDVVVQREHKKDFATNRKRVAKELAGYLSDDVTLPTRIRARLVKLWGDIQAARCAPKKLDGRLAILKENPDKPTWHTLRVQWAAEELSKRATSEECREAAAVALKEITALRKLFNDNPKRVKGAIDSAMALEYPAHCKKAAQKELEKLTAIMNRKTAAPKEAAAALDAWAKLVASSGCAPVFHDTLRKELLKTDNLHPERFKRISGVTPGDPKGRIFIIHAAAAGLRDTKPSPLDPDHLGGEITANFLDNLLHGDFVRRSPRWASAMTALILCLLLGVGTFLIIAMTRSALWVATLSGLISVLAVLSYSLLAYSMYKGAGLWVDVVSPTLFGLVSWAGALGTNFYQEGKNRRFVQDALGRYTSPALVKELMANPRALSLDYGEKRELTVFFSDLAGFTSISERLTPERLVHLLNEYLTEMTDIILEEGGIVDKYIGDAIMAFWGAPAADPDHAIKACRATVRMQKRLAELRPKWKEEYGETVIARCGLNSGLAIAGNMGSKHKFNYTLMGDTVNLASRLEGANKPYDTRVMIGENTHALVKDRVLTRELDFLAVKGKDKPVRVYELIGFNEEVDEKKKELATRSDGALEIYRMTKFQEAMELFQKIIEDYGGDGPSKLYVGRCREYLRSPPPLDWDGVYRMTTK